MHWFEQRPKDIENKIKSSLKSKDAGKATEAKVADFVRKEKEISGFGLNVVKSNNEIAGDLDVITMDEIIEVKKSMKAIKDDLDQFNKYTDSNHPSYFNFDNKKVILYIDKPLKKLHPSDQKRLDIIKGKGIMIVNSLNELKEVLK